MRHMVHNLNIVTGSHCQPKPCFPKELSKHLPKRIQHKRSIIVRMIRPGPRLPIILPSRLERRLVELSYRLMVLGCERDVKSRMCGVIALTDPEACLTGTRAKAAGTTGNVDLL